MVIGQPSSGLEVLAGLDPDSAEGSEYWKRYLEQRVRMNHVRTIAPLISAILLMVSLQVQ